MYVISIVQNYICSLVLDLDKALSCAITMLFEVSLSAYLITRLQAHFTSVF